MSTLNSCKFPDVFLGSEVLTAAPPGPYSFKFQLGERFSVFVRRDKDGVEESFYVPNDLLRQIVWYSMLESITLATPRTVKLSISVKT